MTTKARWTKQVSAAVFCTALFGLAGCFESAAQPTGVREGYLVPAVKGNPGLVLAAGEFRVVAANLIYSKIIDHYHHVYMAQGGDWAKNVTLLPWLRMVTELDPHFVEAYELEGGTILPRTGRLAEGRTVLMEGLKNNPNSWEMCREIAMLYAWTERKPAMALPFAEQGLKYADDDFSRSLMSRLCNTLKDEIAHGMPLTASGRLHPEPVVPTSASEPALLRQVTG